MSTINALSKIFCEATKEVIDSGTGQEVHFAKTIQKIPQVHLKPEIGCFVLFSGDYSGLMIMNFSAEAALAIYRSSMINMGFPAEELAESYTSEEVVDSIGEIINQVIGKVRREVESQYGLSASNTQPKAIALNSAIILSIDGHDVDKEYCRRLAFKVQGHSFHIELSLEKTEFESLGGGEVHKASNAAGQKSQNSPQADSNQFDFESLKKASESPQQEQEIKKADPNQFDFESLKNANVESKSEEPAKAEETKVDPNQFDFESLKKASEGSE